MTESDAMKQMENAIGDLVKEVKPSALRVTPPGLDAGRLLDLARDRLQYARDQLLDIRRTFALKAFEIDSQYQRRLQDAARERDNAIKALDEQSTREAKPAEDIIALVERMLRD